MARQTVVVYDEEVDITDLADDLETLRQAKAEIEKWKEVEDVVKDRIKERLADALGDRDPETQTEETQTVAAKIDGHIVAELTRSTSRRVDVPGLRAVLGEALNPYLKSSTSDRLNLKD